eukprot:sb/3468545/
MGGSSSKKATVVKSAPSVQTDNIMVIQDAVEEIPSAPSSNISPAPSSNHPPPAANKPPRGVMRPDMTSSVTSSPGPVGPPRDENSFNNNTVVKTTTSSVDRPQVARQPLKFDQNNVTKTSSPVRKENGVGNNFTSSISSVNPTSGMTFTKSQNFYNQSRDKSGRFNSAGNGTSSEEVSHYSGVFNRHSDAAAPKPRYDANVASLLKKDKFVLLGSQLQQQESQIFSRNTGTHGGLSGVAIGTFPREGGFGGGNTAR